jgi:transposase
MIHKKISLVHKKQIIKELRKKHHPKDIAKKLGLKTSQIYNLKSRIKNGYNVLKPEYVVPKESIVKKNSGYVRDKKVSNLKKKLLIIRLLIDDLIGDQ